MARIGLISDVHAAPEPVAEAMTIFKEVGVEQILCAGDIAGYMEDLDTTIQLLVENNCMSIIGNHDLSHLYHHEDEVTDAVSFLRELPAIYEDEIEGKSLYMVHAQPPDQCHGGIKLLDREGRLLPDKVELWQQNLKAFNYDILVVGHTHQVYAETIANTLVVNPGSSVFNHSCAILHLPDMTVEVFALSGKAIQKTWNWGEHVIHG